MKVCEEEEEGKKTCRKLEDFKVFSNKVHYFVFSSAFFVSANQKFKTKKEGNETQI
jgi:hypothetical protein